MNEPLMGKYSKLRQKILAGSGYANIEFSMLCRLLARLGFDERIRGSHHVFTQEGIPEIITLQPVGNKAKIYQVGQVRDILVKHRLGESDVD